MQNAIYASAKRQLGLKLIDLSSDDLRVMLVASTYVFDQQHVFADIVAHESAGSGYARKTLTNRTYTQVVVSNVVVEKLDADDFEWVGASFGIPIGMVLFREAASDALRLPIAAFNVAQSQNTLGGRFRVNVNAAGLLLIM